MQVFTDQIGKVCQNQGPDFLGVFIQVLERLEKCPYCCETGNSNPLAQKRI